MNNNSKMLVMETLHHNGVKEELAPVALKKLSNREIEVLVLICQELSPGEISERLSISEKTYFNHRSNILEKTGARTNIGIYKFALRNGLAPDYYLHQGSNHFTWTDNRSRHPHW